MDLNLWTEKYRPKTVADCVLTDSVKKSAAGILESGNLPNLMLSGGAGCGKTTLALALCDEFNYDSLIINCSNDRGIDILRTQITQFASSMSLESDMKVVILDEFDYAGALLQAALRNFMEEFHKTCRFVFTCNFPQRIIQPLHSRCAVLDFNIKGSEKAGIASQIMKRVLMVLDKEGVEYDKSAVAQIVSKFFPDFRRTINELQRYASITGKIDAGVVGALEDLDVADFAKSVKNKDFKTARRWIVENLATVDQQVIFRRIYDSLYTLLEPASIPPAILIIANYQHRSINAVDPEINLSAMTIEMMSELTFK